MAAVTKCDCCGDVVAPNTAMHVMFYNRVSATRHNSYSSVDADVCDTCYRKMLQMLNLEVKVDG